MKVALGTITLTLALVIISLGVTFQATAGLRGAHETPVSAQK